MNRCVVAVVPATVVTWEDNNREMTSGNQPIPQHHVVKEPLLVAMATGKETDTRVEAAQPL